MFTWSISVKNNVFRRKTELKLTFRRLCMFLFRCSSFNLFFLRFCLFIYSVFLFLGYFWQRCSGKVWKFRKKIRLSLNFGYFRCLWEFNLLVFEEKKLWYATAGEVENVPLMSSISWSHFRSDLYRTSKARIRFQNHKTSNFSPAENLNQNYLTKFSWNNYVPPIQGQGRKVFSRLVSLEGKQSDICL